MKRSFRYLILGITFVILLSFTACQGKKGDFKKEEEKTTLDETTQEETSTQMKEIFEYYLTISNVTKLYLSPSLDSEYITELYKNSLIKVILTEDEEWKKVKIDNRIYAYISSKDIQYVGQNYTVYNDYQICDEEHKYAYVNVDVGNVRDLPDMKGEVVGKYKYGETIQVLGVTKNNWNVIMYNNNICYVSSDIIQYISKEEYDLYNFKITKAEFDENNTTLIGSYITNYAPVNGNRGYNIELGVKNMNGYVIPPGALFDWCRDMGQCGKNEGFKESTEIVNGEYVKGYGGGVCQISSTLCAALLTSEGNFEFFERHKHSKAQKYIPREYDATVSYPNVNFIFKNSNDYSVYIKAECENGNLKIEIYKMI